jgi:hypothetical protein
MEHPHVNGEMNEADAQLIADAPLLLEEVKRLRERMNDMLHRLEMEERDAGHAEQELEYWIDTWKQWIKEMIE